MTLSSCDIFSMKILKKKKNSFITTFNYGTTLQSIKKILILKLVLKYYI